MSVLITGGGLIGSQIARLEVEAGRTPVIFDLAPRPEALADFVDVDKVKIVRGDVTNPLDLVGAVEANDVRRIIHTAAYGNLTIGSNQNPLTSTLVNTMGAAYALEIARIYKMDRIVLASSSTLYMSMVGGEDEGQYGYEEAYPRPNNVYAANKQAAEDLGRAYQNTFGVDVVAVRYAAVFGPWGPGGGGMATTLMEKWLRSAMAGDPAEVSINGADWIYSKDAARGTHLACWADGLEDRLFNLGMGRTYSSQDIADGINAVTADGRVTPSANATQAPNRFMNIDRAQKQLGWTVEFPMDKAIADYRDWLGHH
jgi:nucleoside-diphosphate-sugar epimerase